MKRLSILLVLILWPFICLLANDWQIEVDNNAAFYSGETLNYVISPPPRFKMVEKEAKYDGYSFAFLPDSAKYNTTDILIGVNIYKIRELPFENIIKQDTTMLRNHFGEQLRIWEVDHNDLKISDQFTTFYINDTSRFIPNVMISYINGTTELIILELIITDKVTKRDAENLFVDCLHNTKIMRQGELTN